LEIEEKNLLLALGSVENTAVLIRSIPNFSNIEFDDLGKNLQDHPHGVIFEIEANLFTWFRNYRILGLNKKNRKTKFEFRVDRDKFVKSGIAEVHLIYPDVTFRDQLKKVCKEKSVRLFSLLVLRILSLLTFKALGKNLYFKRANVWFQFEQGQNNNSFLNISPTSIHFEWNSSQADLDFVKEAIEHFERFFEDKGFKVSKVNVFRDSCELDKWSSEACHPSGTIPLGNDASSCVADYFGKVHTIPQTYLLGASLFPTAGWFNPTLLIMAYSRLVVSKIHKGSNH
jgi:choline dehydrogenase-like flavoprotein